MTYTITRTFGDDILDLSELNSRFEELPAVEDWDDDDREFARLYLILEHELWDDIDSAMRNEPTLILSDYFEEYAEELANEIGAVDSNASWPVNRIDWAAAADDLKIDYSELRVGRYIYYRRAY